jgi:hypothetical protein
MSNRFDQQFPRTDWQAVPPIDADRLQAYLQRARQLRAEALAEGLKLTARALARAFVAIVRFIRYAGYQAASRGYIRHHHIEPITRDRG